MKNQAAQSPEKMDSEYKEFSNAQTMNIVKTEEGIELSITSKFKSDGEEDSFEATVTGKTVDEAWNKLQDEIFNRLEEGKDNDKE